MRGNDSPRSSGTRCLLCRCQCWALPYVKLFRSEFNAYENSVIGWFFFMLCKMSLLECLISLCFISSFVDADYLFPFDTASL